MAQLFKVQSSKLKEGEFINSWFRRRLLDKNQNVLKAITGGTGSGKSYYALSEIHTYYKQELGKPFPVENIVFSPLQLIQRLKYFETNNMTGEILLCDEWGINNSSHDWQSSTQKVLGYIMQSFRSMNVGLVFTLPVLTMLNKSTRLLLHAHFITAGIDYETKMCTVKPLFHQLNQTTGKSFWKYPKIILDGMRRKIKRLSVGLAPKELLEVYELKKARFVSKQLDDAEMRLLEEEEKGDKRQRRNLLTIPQLEALGLTEEERERLFTQAGFDARFEQETLESRQLQDFTIPLLQSIIGLQPGVVPLITGGQETTSLESLSGIIGPLLTSILNKEN